MKEFVIWGTKNGVEDVVRVNGQEVQTDLKRAKYIKGILEMRGEFEKIRIAVLDMSNFDAKSEFTRGVEKK